MISVQSKQIHVLYDCLHHAVVGMRNTQFEVPRHQGNCTEILDAWLYIAFALLVSGPLPFAKFLAISTQRTLS